MVHVIRPAVNRLAWVWLLPASSASTLGGMTDAAAADPTAFPIPPTPITAAATVIEPERYTRPADMLSGTTWALGIAYNEQTGFYHWIAWKGAAAFGNPSFDETMSHQMEQVAQSAEEAERLAVEYALEAELLGTYP